ncbi:MAG: hypothetical protein DCF31_16435 [Alphaproteobacteria bacterium]|nr:MAG: hypothetical protein DCF31_16435 [Alphaproteobacteria bacterium]
MLRTLLFAVAISAALPAGAQAGAADPDPARLAAAKALIEVVMPPALREQMTDQTSVAIMVNVTQGFANSPQIMAAFAAEPRAEAIIKRYIARQQQATQTLMKANMPDMLAAITRAYARQFSVTQMTEARAFFATPAGQAYVIQAPRVMADPDVGAWMQKMMATSMANVPAEIATMQAELRALKPAANPADPEPRR